MDPKDEDPLNPPNCGSEFIVGSPDPPPAFGEDAAYIVALKGLAPPVAWGLRPTPGVGLVSGCELKVPTPVGCCPMLETPVPKAEVAPFGADVEEMLLGVPVTLGVVGLDCGIGGSDSNKDAPNDDVGLNGLIPLKPVIWGFNWPPKGDMEGVEEVMVAPVGCVDSGEKEENEESDAVSAVAVEDALWGLSIPEPLGPNLLSSDFRPNAKDEATLDIDDSPPNAPGGPKKPVCCGCWV